MTISIWTKMDNKWLGDVNNLEELIDLVGEDTWTNIRQMVCGRDPWSNRRIDLDHLKNKK